MRYLYLLLLIFPLYACYSASADNYKPSKYEKIADGITDATAKKIEAETKLQLIGTGGGMMNHIRMMAMSFNCYKELSTEQGRALVIYCVDKYLAAINANEEIRPHLIQYPLTPENIEIRIFIHKPDRTDVPIGNLVVVSAIHGKVAYKIKQEWPVILKRIHEETYDEAVGLLKKAEAKTGDDSRS